VKIRLGFSPDAVNVEDNARLIASAGADMLTIHGRTRADSYNVRVNHEGIARGFRAMAGSAPGIMKVGNGDVMDRASGLAMMEQTGCDAVMVSRGALGNPWIFKQLLDPAALDPTIGEWLEVVLRQIDYHGEFHGDDIYSAHRLRKHLLWYAGGFPRCNRLRRILNSVETLDGARRLIGEYAAEFPSDLRRFEELDALSARILTDDPKYQMDRALDRGVGDDGLPAVPHSMG
jgi:tRNA-dihydrouridine synthase